MKFSNALSVFKMVKPSMLPGKLGRVIGTVKKVLFYKRIITSDKPVDEFAYSLGSKVVNKNFSKRVKRSFTNTCKDAIRSKFDKTRKNGLGGRFWFKMNDNGRNILPVVVVFHDADKAGKHLDIHIGRTSLVVRVSGKPAEGYIKYHSDGRLTGKAKAALMDLLKDEIANGSRVVHNLDHTVRNARSQWFVQGRSGGYGDGRTRQIISTGHAEVHDIRRGSGKTAILYSPIFRTDGLCYIYNLYSGDDKKAPILIFGKYKSKPPEEITRLRLKYIQDMDKFLELVNHDTITKKYDGASAYFRIDCNGVKMWSPRISSNTGERIEYTHKFPELSKITSEKQVTGMCEVMFKHKFNIVKPNTWFNRHLKHYEVSGILNSNSIRTGSVIPDIRPYRIDSYDGIDVSGIGFHDTMRITNEISGEYISPPELVKPGYIGQDWEGLVGYGFSRAYDGFKYKPFGETSDWVVTCNNLKISDKGVPAGVLVFKSLGNGREYKLGPGQIGSFDFVNSIIQSGDNVVDKVAKVKSKRGHEGRSSKFIDWHLDKGVG